MNMHTAMTPDLSAIKAKQQIAWSSGDYAVVGTTLQIVGDMLCEAVALRSGQRVLDVAAGNGNATLAAARRFADVVSTDYVGELLERGRERAAADRLSVAFQQADAENLPFAEESFDVVLSTFGVMFTPNQEKAAKELLRVCKPGGKIGLANWVPDGYVGNMLRTVGKHIPPPAGVKPPPLWGTEDRLRELLGEEVSSIESRRRTYVFRYLSANHFIEQFRSYYGPVHKAFESLDVDGRDALENDLKELIEEWNISGDETVLLPSDYLEVVAVRR